MILLDTNVISELMRAKPHAAVRAWFARQAGATLHTTAISAAEIAQGLAMLPSGKRREQLHLAATQLFENIFRGRVHPFDHRCARHFGSVVARRRALARPVSFGDAAIAAIAIELGASVATRDTGGFRHMELVIVNPWED